MNNAQIFEIIFAICLGIIIIGAFALHLISNLKNDIENLCIKKCGSIENCYAYVENPYLIIKCNK